MTAQSGDRPTTILGAAWRVLAAAAGEWTRHRSSRMGAALAYYSVFSMGPLLLIVTAIAGFFFGEDAARGQLSDQFRGALGETGAKALEAMLAGTASEGSGWLAALLGVGVLVFAALGVVVQLKDALNTIWNVEETAVPAFRSYARAYAGSLLAILALGFLFVASLVVSAVIAAFGDWIGGGPGGSALLRVLDFVVSFAVLAALFAFLFKWFPDTRVTWGDAWPGAVVTAILFNIGKLAIGWYVGTQSFESTYGAAASLVVLLVWVYYSAQIVLFGAELTHAYAHERGSRRGAPIESKSPHVAAGGA